ncbi:MAG: nitrilase family protein [Prevotellaceae bacterium]|nr:nitrilase family protein [Prevotellaceae bacterium]
MKVTLLQQDIEWSAPEINLAKAERAISAAPASDLYVLPEMFATGFNVSPEGIVEDAESGPARSWMCRMADKYNAAIAGSVAVRESDGSCFNRFYFVRPGGDISHYDKRHLFTYGGEDLGYQRGEERVIINWRGVRIFLQVCYDLRFPVWSRNARLSDTENLFDLILYVASWPSTRMNVWTTLLPARAIENQCYVCGVNRIGSDPYCTYVGRSMFVDPYGRITECGAGEETLTADIDLPKLTAFRHKFPVLDDRD